MLSVLTSGFFFPRVKNHLEILSLEEVIYFTIIL